MDFENDIKLHEEFKEASIAIYDKSSIILPKGYSVIDFSVDKNNGFRAMAMKKDNNIVIVFCGSNDWEDVVIDSDMFIEKAPKQYVNAIDFYESLKSQPRYRHCNFQATGHSLGGTLAQLLGALKGLQTVTFNAYGAKNLLSEHKTLHTENIVNYCNDKDPITTINATNHIGECYLLQNEETTSNVDTLLKFNRIKNKIPGYKEHLIDLAKPIETRRKINKIELEKPNNIKTGVKEIAKWVVKEAKNTNKLGQDIYSTGKIFVKDNLIKPTQKSTTEKYDSLNDNFIVPIKKDFIKLKNYIPNNYLKSTSHSSRSSNDSECAGTYQVRAYTRDNGEHVKAHMRTCGAKHEK